MLVLQRKPQTSVWIGDDICVKVLDVKHKNVRLGICAPREIAISREELRGSTQDPPVDPPAEGPPGGIDSLDVLVIEDDRSHGELIKKALRASGISRIRLMRTGEEAVSLLLRIHRGESKLPDLVLLDLGLPDIPGIDVLRTMRALTNCALIPTVVLSSSELSDDVVLSLKSGANAFVPKTCRYAEFRRSIQRIAEFWLHTRPAA